MSRPAHSSPHGKRSAVGTATALTCAVGLGAAAGWVARGRSAPHGGDLAPVSRLSPTDSVPPTPPPPTPPPPAAELGDPREPAGAAERSDPSNHGTSVADQPYVSDPMGRGMH